MSTVASIRATLERELAPSVLEIEDQSAAHAGHAGTRDGGGHYQVRIVALIFAGKPPLVRHRLVYTALASMMKGEIHALAIHARSPDEL